MIKIETIDTRLVVTVPYHPRFVRFALDCDAVERATSQTWVFCARQEFLVRAICLELFGDDGSPIPPADMLTIRTDFMLAHCVLIDCSWLCCRENQIGKSDDIDLG